MAGRAAGWDSSTASRAVASGSRTSPCVSGFSSSPPVGSATRPAPLAPPRPCEPKVLRSAVGDPIDRKPIRIGKVSLLQTGLVRPFIQVIARYVMSQSQVHRLKSISYV